MGEEVRLHEFINSALGGENETLLFLYPQRSNQYTQDRKLGRPQSQFEHSDTVVRRKTIVPARS
jgi:hypothetical protein